MNEFNASPILALLFAGKRFNQEHLESRGGDGVDIPDVSTHWARSGLVQELLYSSVSGLQRRAAAKVNDPSLTCTLEKRGHLSHGHADVFVEPEVATATVGSEIRERIVAIFAGPQAGVLAKLFDRPDVAEDKGPRDALTPGVRTITRMANRESAASRPGRSAGRGEHARGTS